MTFCPAVNFTQKMNGSCILRADLRFSYPEKNAILVALQKKQEENTMTYGYARVSAADQNLNRQLDDFLAFGVAREKIFCDKRSGKDFKRSSYLRLLKKLKKGDLLVIKSIDRLGRNYDMIIEEWAHITKRIGADIVVLDMPILDTRTRAENLTGRLISDIVLQLLSYVAQKEREDIQARQREGIASAKKRGVRFGRPRICLPENFDEVVLDYRERRKTLQEALAATDMKKSTFYACMRLRTIPCKRKNCKE